MVDHFPAKIVGTEQSGGSGGEARGAPAAISREFSSEADPASREENALK
jgi:hypothetical protein